MKKYKIVITDSQLPEYPVVYQFEAHSDHGAYTHLVTMKNSFVNLGLQVQSSGWYFCVVFTDGNTLEYELSTVK